MHRHLLLVVGTALIGFALIGGVVSPTFDNTGFNGWTGFSHMSDRGHMGGLWSSADYSEGGSAIEGAREVTVVGTEFLFSPEVFTVTQGEPVNVTFVNDGRILHDFTIPELGISVQAGPGEEATVGFTPEEAGVYSIVCTLPGHASQGMTATLVVEADK